MDVKQMREYILGMYPGDKWVYKVAHMSDNQVIAVYYSMKKKGQKPVEDKRNKKQLTIFDYDSEGRCLRKR